MTESIRNVDEEPLVRQADNQIQMRLIEEDARARENMSSPYSGFFRQDQELFEYNSDELSRNEFY
jgi:hypothetical protein